LFGANLYNANLTDADLNGANLSGAHLRGALGLTQKQIDGAIGDDETQLPAGLQHPEGWSKGAPEDSGA
jgi:Pentapeptide repeats (8 copies)